MISKTEQTGALFPALKTASMDQTQHLKTAKAQKIKKLYLAVALFALDISLLQINIKLGLMATALTSAIFATIVMPDYAGAARQVVGRPLPSPAKTAPLSLFFKRLFAAPKAPQIR